MQEVLIFKRNCMFGLMMMWSNDGILFHSQDVSWDGIGRGGGSSGGLTI